MPPDRLIGSTIARYQILSLLGRGGMSVVYLAEDVRLERKVALKLLSEELASDKAFRDRFIRESRLAASLDHPNVIPIFEADEADGVLFIAMRYVEGTDLKTRIREDGPLPLGLTVSVIAQVASALDAAHERGLVHRDVKPGNVLLAKGRSASAPHAYLADFGLTKRAASQSGLTGTGQFMGTLDYVAPEQIRGEALDGRVDTYALGAVAFECLTGEPPFPKESDVAVLYAQLNEDPPRPTEKREDLPPAVDGVITRAMDKDPGQRHQTAGELADELSSALGVAAPTVPPPARPRTKGPIPRLPGGRPALVGAAAALVALIVGAILLFGGKGGTRGAGTSPSSTASASLSPTALTGGVLLRIDPATNALAGEPIQAGKSADGVAAGGGAVWVVDRQGGAIKRIDPANGDILKSIPAGRPSGVATGNGVDEVWFITVDTASRIDPITNDVDQSVQLSGQAKDITAGEGFVWVSGIDVFKLDRIEPTTGAVRNHASIPDTSGSIHYAAGEGALWAENDILGATDLYRIDPSERRIEATKSFADQASIGLVVGGGAVWALTSNGVVSRFDPDTLELTKRISTPPGASGIAFGEAGVWVLNHSKGTVTRIDPETNSVVATIDVGKAASAIAVGEGSVWVTGTAV